MHINEVEPGRCAPVSEQARLDVLKLEWFAQQWVVIQIDLTDGEIIRRPPICMNAAQFVFGKGIDSRRRCSADGRFNGTHGWFLSALAHSPRSLTSVYGLCVPLSSAVAEL